MVQKLMVVTLVVNDQAKALDFYTRALGLEKRADYVGPTGVRWLTVAPKGQDIEISLFPGGSFPDPKRGQVQVRRGEGIQWTFQTADCKKDFEEMKSRGVRFDESKPAEFAWGIEAHFADPDGNRFAMLQPMAKQVW
jgi:predicted enzyme related to lactoylglutathione lyase